jgi:hypothetical protein
MGGLFLFRLGEQVADGPLLPAPFAAQPVNTATSIIAHRTRRPNMLRRTILGRHQEANNAKADSMAETGIGVKNCVANTVAASCFPKFLNRKLCEAPLPPLNIVYWDPPPPPIGGI